MEEYIPILVSLMVYMSMGLEGIRRNFEEVGGRRRNYSGGAGGVLESGHPRGIIVPRSTS